LNYLAQSSVDSTSLLITNTPDVTLDNTHNVVNKFSDKLSSD